MKVIDLVSLLKKANNAEEINEHREEIGELIPKVRIMFDYNQRNRAHQFDLWMHSINVVVNLPRDLDDDMLYLAALFHDIGKPDSQCKGNKLDDTNIHYYGHSKKGREIIDSVIIPDLDKKGYKMSDAEAERLLYYVEFHDDYMNKKLKHVKRHMKLVSFNEFKNLMLLQVADAKAHIQFPIIAERIKICSALAGKEGEALYGIALEQRERENL